MGFASPQDDSARTEQRSPTGRSVGGRGMVLVVDDEPALREIMALTLRDAGYGVLTAGGGREALEIAGGPDSQIDLVVTDLVMPGMSGTTLARKLRSIRPHVPLVYTSAYPIGTMPAEMQDQIDDPLLIKPFRYDELVEAVRNRLAHAR